METQDDFVQPAEAPPPGAKPAIVINIQSASTPLVALAMLVAGVAVGWFGRPVVENRREPVVAAAPTADPQTAADRAELMSMLMGQTKHFKGNPDAPITLLEFGDFQ